MPSVICGDQRSATGVVRPGLEVGDRLLQHRLVELEADLLDVAGLLFAEQIAGAADVEVVRGELEAGAEVLQRLQHLQPPLRLRRDLALRRQREQRIGAQFRAPHAAAQLIELRQAEHIGAMHDQRVGVRNVEAGFDDRGRQQDVVLAVVERRHDVFDHRRRHLAVRDRDLHLRHMLVEEILCLGEIVDARADIERLAAAIALAQQRLAHHQRIEGRDERAHRQPIHRRRSDDRQFAHAGQRQLQRARDRRGAQRQHMHLGAQLLQPLLVRNAEMLLLVDDQQAEIPELDRLAEQRMGADDDVDRAVGDPLLDLRRAPWSATRREAWATFTGKPLKRSVKVLVCWRASSVVGTTTATCLPSSAAANAARSATSVLPKPTSPQIETVHRPSGLEVASASHRSR